jgi:hypothetical protein
MRRCLVPRNSDSRFREEHASEVVHAAIVAHAAHDALRVAGVRNVGVGEGAPFNEFFTRLSMGLVRTLSFRVELGMRESGKGLLFTRSIAGLGDEALEKPADGREKEEQETEGQGEVDDYPADESFGAHVGAQVEVGTVELAALVQTPGTVDERDICGSLDAVCEETAETMFHAKAG